MRIVIVGAGVIGLLTAVHCARAGHEVALYEQDEIPSPRGTSFDRHRVLRTLQPGDQAATKAAMRAHRQWIELQNLLSAEFYERVGALTVLPGRSLSQSWTMLDRAGSRARVLTPADLRSRYPQFRFPAEAGAVLEPHVGVLLADRVLTAGAAWLRLHSRAELHPRRRVAGVDAQATTLWLEDGESVRADAILLAAGPRSRELLAPEISGQLVLHRQSMLYCEVPPDEAAPWSTTPAISSFGVEHGAWLVPPVADTPLKLSSNSACRVVAGLDGPATPLIWRDHLLEVFSEVLPGLGEDWLFGTRDCYFLGHGAAGGALVVELARSVFCFAACGGGSFKFAPLIARSLTERLTGFEPAPTGLRPVDRAVPAAARDPRPPRIVM